MSRNDNGSYEDNSNPDDLEMEEWMNTWQQTEPSHELTSIRETFASAQWRRRLKDIVTLIVLIVAAAACAMALAAPEFLSVALLAAFGLVVASGLTWKRYRRMQRERSSMPLSPAEYLEASKHNLSLLERENRFTRWIFPIVIPLVLAANIWIAYDLYEVYAMSAGSTGLLIAVTIVVLGYACWRTYMTKPVELKKEREALHDLESELHSD